MSDGGAHAIRPLILRFKFSSWRRHICVVFILPSGSSATAQTFACLASRAWRSQHIAVVQNWSPSVVSDGRFFLRALVCLRPRSRIDARISPMINSDRRRKRERRRQPNSQIANQQCQLPRLLSILFIGSRNSSLIGPGPEKSPTTRPSARPRCRPTRRDMAAGDRSVRQLLEVKRKTSARFELYRF
jgi:hypothetical protein